MLRVLIIEDVLPMAELLKVVIESTGLATVSGVAHDLSTARVELYRRRPDLVILDTVLGTENGLDLVEELAQIELPFVIVVAGDAEGPLEGASRRIQAFKPDGGLHAALGYLLKPEWDGARIRSSDIELFSQMIKSLERS